MRNDQKCVQYAQPQGFESRTAPGHSQIPQLCGELVVAWMSRRSVVNKNLSYKSFSRSMHERKLRRRHHENQQSSYYSDRRSGSLASFGSWLLIFEKGNHVAFVIRRSVVNRLERLLSTSCRRFLEISIYHRGRQAIRIQYQSSERRKREWQHALSCRNRLNLPAYSRLVFQTNWMGPYASPGIREDREQGRIPAD